MLLERPRHSAIAADTPEVYGHEYRSNQRQADDMQRVEANEGVRTDLEATAHDEDYGVTKDGGRAHHVRTDGDGPQRQLVPRQQIARKAEEQGKDEQNDAHHPVELTRRLVSARIEDAHHMQQYSQNHAMRHPAVHVAHERAVADVRLERRDVRIRALDGGHVIEHEQDARDREAEEEEEAQTAQ